MLGFLSPHEYSLIHASLFAQVRLAVCGLLPNSLKHLKELSSPWFFTAISPWLPPELGHQLLQDISYFQLPLANTDAWKEALEKSESCSHLFFRVCRVLVSWCSEAYLISSSFWLLVFDPVQQTSLLAPICAQKCPRGSGGTTCWTCSKLHCSLVLEHLPAEIPCPGGDNSTSLPCTGKFSTQHSSWQLLLERGDLGFPFACLLHCLVHSVLAQELQSWVVRALRPKKQVPLAPACGRGDLALRLWRLQGDRAGVPPSCREWASL